MVKPPVRPPGWAFYHIIAFPYIRRDIRIKSVSAFVLPFLPQLPCMAQTA